MLNQVRAGMRADELAHSIDLRRHGTIAADSDANAVSIRAMYRHSKQ